ncbi:MAG: phycobilisome rod-core linker polypeptide [Synechococcus sp.]
MNFGSTSRLGLSLYETSDPLERWPGQSNADTEVVIRAIYRQVLGNVHIMDSERPIALESRLRNGELSVSEFVRALGKSALYVKRFCDCPRFRQIELGYKHFLGRAPNSYAEMLAGTAIMDRGGFDALVDFFVDSDEFKSTFGSDTVPYIRGYKSDALSSNAGFSYMFELLGGPASSDAGKASVLNASITQEKPKTIAPVYKKPVILPYQPPTKFTIPTAAPAATPAAPTFASTPAAVPGKVPSAPGGAQAPLLGEAATSGGFFGKILSFVEKLTGGGEAPAAAEAGQVAASAAPEQPKKAFFLEPDEAISLGNVEYMRTPRTVRRSFPNVAEPDKPLEFEAVVDATKKVITPEAEKPTGIPSALAPKKEEVKIPVVIAPFAPGVKVSESLKEFGTTASRAGKSGPYVSMSMSPEVSVRRNKDSSLDAFRKMATAIRKGE